MSSLKTQLKVSSFYGDRIARPYVLLDKDGNAVKEGRVEAPKINDALIEWASKVPVRQGGTLVKPHWDGPDAPKGARTDFQIFFQEQYDDILAANPALFDGAVDRKAMLMAGSVYWRETLTNEERQEYRERAKQEKVDVAEQIAEAEQQDPKFKTFREKLQKYKESVGNILSAAKASAGPLWKAQRRMNANYRLLGKQEDEQGAEEQHSEEEEEEGQQQGQDQAGGSKGRKGAAAGGKKGGKAAPAQRGKGKKKAVATKRLVESESSSEEEEEEEGAAAEAAEAMEKLMLATAKKGAKKPPAAARGAASKDKAQAGAGRRGAAASKATAVVEKEEEISEQSDSEEDDSSEEEEQSEQDEEVEESPRQQQQARGGRRGTRSGAAVLAERVAASNAGRKGMYADAFELPPSQSSTPAKGRRGPARKEGKAGKPAAAGSAAALPAKSPGKRTRSTRHAAVAAAAAPVEESPAKKARRSARK